jgi:hypothetical protein
VLSADQRTGANWFGGVFALALGSVAWWLVADNDVGFFCAIVLAILSICVAATFNRTGRPRMILGSSTAALAVLAAGAGWLILADNSAGLMLVNAFTIGFIGFQLLANSLSTR